MELKVNIKKRLHQFTLEANIETDAPMALLGASGSGKSMTLKCIAGIEKPDEGVIILNGRTLFDSEKNINLSPQKRNVGYLFQNYALFPNMTVKQNIQVASKKSAEETENLISNFYLSGLENKYPREISGGQQQRTALARIIASEPEAILLDEPFSAIDSYMRWKLEMTVSDIINDFGGLTVMVTHDRNEAYRNCRRICIINDGKIEVMLNGDEFMHQSKTVGAARISGCKNIYGFVKTNEDRQIFVPELNIYLSTDRNADENQKYVGLRAHYFSTDGLENRIDCEVERVIGDVFSTIIMLKPISAESKDSLIRFETDKEKAAGLNKGDKMSVYIDSKDILLLE
ncbi:MAG: ATP-binding cassette domain-containing protein [Clostridiales bacterium]|nr:ATP-binding cassette domain-containing protein [Clostridiales bacterium]